MSLLACHGLTRRPWWEGFDLTLAAGEVAVLSGASGSGKTLLLRTLADLDPCDAGAVSLDGVAREAMSAAQWRRRVLYVHPAGACLPGTVAENLGRVTELAVERGRPTLQGGGDGASAVAATPSGESSTAMPLSMPRLDPAADTRQLSSGEAQALALRRALLCEPRVLLLDEASAHLDVAAARAWERYLRGWAAEGRAILWVSHDRELALRLGATRVPWP